MNYLDNNNGNLNDFEGIISITIVQNRYGNRGRLMDNLVCSIPPMPIFIKGGLATFRKGESHFHRVFHIFDLLYVVQGTLYMMEDGKEFEVSEGQYLFLVPGKYHGGYKGCDEETKYYWVHFSLSGEWSLETTNDLDWSKIIVRDNTFTESAQYNLNLPRFGKFRSFERGVEAFSIIKQLDESNNPPDKLKQQMFFNDILIQIQQDAIELPSSAKTVTDEVIKYIREHYDEQDFKVKEMAKVLLYHPDYLTRSMKKVIGMTPIQYLNHYRISIAKSKLVNEHKDLATIAVECGFSDVSYFSRTFKKREGITPGEYRRLRGR
ncbi:MULTISPECIES: AraC family transcriptional regulator [Bacillaceae]|uniref:AraC family transcriptional regulator n=1 Tax=Evansella alkalicola TaxID=745819 RepID=A0ABS6JVX8_9BACI|nr:MULTISPECIES: helix-turn-helix domain-containing protein [Bacillaceae]MBU9721844.1 AraC family transcriptional regulator [Bacillus alkalicola]